MRAVKHNRDVKQILTKSSIMWAMKKKIDPEMSAAAAAMGRKGGPARAKALTKERRREIARKAAQKRWADEKAAK